MVKAEKEVAIRVEGVSKAFKIPHEKHSSLKSAVLNIFQKKTYSKYEAAKNISFEVKTGEFFGIIGRNGCGKSTMLKMLAGIYLPDKGKITIAGSLSPFLELGVGFNPDLTARDNVYLNGTLLGLTRKEIDEKFDEIIRFAELEDFVDQKLKNFSSGMQVRLAFSVAIRAHAEILLIDEVLAVGDANFQQKCFSVFRKLKKEGKTIIFVSHSMNHIMDFCDKVILINDGEKVYEGRTKEGIDNYLTILSEDNQDDQEIKPVIPKESIIKAVKILVDGEQKNAIKCGESLQLQISYKQRVKSAKLNFGVAMFRDDGFYVMGINTMSDKYYHKIGGAILLEFPYFQIISPGKYYFEIKIFEEDINKPLAWLKETAQFLVQDSPVPQRGFIKLDYKWKE